MCGDHPPSCAGDSFLSSTQQALPVLVPGCCPGVSSGTFDLAVGDDSLQACCTLELSGELYKTLMPGSHPTDSDVMCLGCGLNMEIFKSFPSDSNVQSGFEDHCLGVSSVSQTS